MRRIYPQSDLKLTVIEIGNPQRFKVNFYTERPDFYIRKTSEDVQDGYIKLNWTELSSIGAGVLNATIYSLTDDMGFDDDVYDVSYSRTLNYYIMTSENPEESLYDLINEVKEDLTAEITRSTSEDITLQNDITDEATARVSGDNYEHQFTVNGLNQLNQEMQTALASKANSTDLQYYLKTIWYDPATQQLKAGNTPQSTLVTVNMTPFLKDNYIDDIRVDYGSGQLSETMCLCFDYADNRQSIEIPLSQLYDDNLLWQALTGETQARVSGDTALNNLIVSVGNDVDALEDDITVIEGELLSITGSISALDTRMTAVEASVTGINDLLSAI